MRAVDDITQVITYMGFTALEAEVYVYLLQRSPATGYKIATSIGRSFANTYKALASLQEKGAVLVDDGSSKLTRAVPLEELLDQMQSRFSNMRKRAIEAMAKLTPSDEDTRIYELVTVPQVIERARRMLDSAEERVLIELFPEPLSMLKEAVEETAARGVVVCARIYQPDNLAGVHVVQSPFGDETLRKFRSQWIAVFVDGRQFLLGHLFTGEEDVYQAIWSRNPFLARAFYDYVNSDLHHYAFRSRLESVRTLEEARKAYAEMEALFPPGGDLGFLELRALMKREWNSRSAAEGVKS
jgi:sugar-specific transcriptional regulator TrmB